jgi:hypothetical protein
MFTLRVAAITICAALMPECISAQSAADAFKKAPAGVEEALRGRVSGYFTLQKEGKFRQAEAFVCDESRDTYYDSDKRRWTSLEIVRVTFEKEYQEAKVLVALGTEMTQRGSRVPAIFPMNSWWKSQAGQWCLYIPPPNKEQTLTPFGIMKQTEAGEGQKAGPRVPVSPQQAVEQILSSIRFSKRELKVKGYEKSSDELEVLNQMPGTLQVGVIGVAPPGMKWQLTKSELKQGERAIFKVEYEPADQSPKSTREIKILLEPLGFQVPVKILFDIPESVKQQLPPAVRP